MRKLAGVLLLAAAMWPSAQQASAGTITAADLVDAKVVTHEYSVHPHDNFEGGTVSCPDGMRAISGGSFWHRRGFPPDAEGPLLGVTSSLAPTPNGRGWLGAGIVYRGLRRQKVFQVSVRCVRAGLLKGVKFREATLTARKQIRAVDVRCPAGTVILNGGGYTSLAHRSPPGVSLYAPVYGSVATSLNYWRVLATDAYPRKRVMHAVVNCIPQDRVPTLAVSQSYVDVAYLEQASFEAECAPGYYELSGGAAWITGGNPVPTPESSFFTSIAANATSADGQGHYVSGSNLRGDGAQMLASSFCVGP